MASVGSYIGMPATERARVLLISAAECIKGLISTKEDIWNDGSIYKLDTYNSATCTAAHAWQCTDGTWAMIAMFDNDVIRVESRHLKEGSVQFKLHERTPLFVAGSFDYFVIGCIDIKRQQRGSVFLCKLFPRLSVATIQLQAEPVSCSVNMSYLAVGTADGTVSVISTTSQHVLAKFAYPAASVGLPAARALIRAVHISPPVVFVGGTSGILCSFPFLHAFGESSNDMPCLTSSAHSPITCIDSSDGAVLTLTEDGVCRIWEKISLGPVASHQVEHPFTMDVNWHDYAVLLSSTSVIVALPFCIVAWDVETGKVQRTQRTNRLIGIAKLQNDIVAIFNADGTSSVERADTFLSAKETSLQQRQNGQRLFEWLTR